MTPPKRPASTLRRKEPKLARGGLVKPKPEGYGLIGEHTNEECAPFGWKRLSESTLPSRIQDASEPIGEVKTIVREGDRIMLKIKLHPNRSKDPERHPCCIMFCHRTIGVRRLFKNDPESIPAYRSGELVTEWICAVHWKTPDKRLKRLYRQAVAFCKRYSANGAALVAGKASDRRHRLWCKLKAQAATAASGGVLFRWQDVDIWREKADERGASE